MDKVRVTSYSANFQAFRNSFNVPRGDTFYVNVRGHAFRMIAMVGHIGILTTEQSIVRRGAVSGDQAVGAPFGFQEAMDDVQEKEQSGIDGMYRAIMMTPEKLIEPMVGVFIKTASFVEIMNT